MAKVERASDLPEWFDIGKYNDCESFGAIEWFDQLSRRAKLFESNAAWMSPLSISKIDRPEVLSVWRALTFGEYESIQSDPLRKRDAQCLERADSQPISSIGTIDFFYQRMRDSVAARDGLCPVEKSLRWNALDDSSIAGIDAIRAAQNYPLYFEAYPPQRPPHAVIRVDLGATDSALKKSFDSWLAQARAELPADVRKPANPIYSKWARYGLLPYLDLRLWEEGTGNKIPDRVMSRAISRNEHYEMGEENIRKTLAPLANRLMKDLSALQALAAIEAADRAAPETL